MIDTAALIRVPAENTALGRFALQASYPLGGEIPL